MQRKGIFIFIILAFCIIVDQITKYIAKATLLPLISTSYLGDVFRLHYAENRGAFLSLGAMLPSEARFWVFTMLASVVLVIILIYAITSDEQRPLPTLSYALIVGGGFGNLIDRIINDGAVIDFMNIGIGSVRSGIFNVADMAITIGIIVLVGLSFWPSTPEVPELEDAAAIDDTGDEWSAQNKSAI